MNKKDVDIRPMMACHPSVSSAWLLACYLIIWPMIARGGTTGLAQPNATDRGSAAAGMVHPNATMAARLYGNVHEGYILMSITNSAHIRLLDNWLAALRTASAEWPSKCIVACLDRGLLALVESRNVSALYTVEFLEPHIVKMYSLDNTTLRSLGGEKKYGKYENYNIINRVKVSEHSACSCSHACALAVA